MNTPQVIEDQADMRKYFCMIEHIADDELDPYEYRLLGHYKRVCGSNGKVCTEGIRTSAQRCQMSASKASQVRQSLAEKGWIELEYVTINHGNTSEVKEVIVRLVNRWLENVERYSQTCVPHEHPVFTTRTGCSPHEQKNNYIEQEQIKDSAPALLSPLDGAAGAGEAPDGAHQSEPDQPLEKWGFKVGQIAYWWFEEGQKYVPGTVVRFTARFVILESRDKRGNIRTIKRGPRKVSQTGSTETWTTVKDLTPRRRIIAMQTYSMADADRISGGRMEEINMHDSDLEFRFGSTGSGVEAKELLAAYGWHKDQGLSAPKKRGGIGDMLGAYRDAYGPPASGSLPPATPGCPECDGAGSVSVTGPGIPSATTLPCPACYPEAHAAAVQALKLRVQEGGAS